MLRFFSRRKPKGRKEQRPGAYCSSGNGTYRKPLGPTPKNKNILACKIILLDGTDLSIDISVRMFIIYIYICYEIGKRSFYLY